MKRFALMPIALLCIVLYLLNAQRARYSDGDTPISRYLHDFLRRDDLKGLLAYCSSEEGAIDSLLNYRLDETFNVDQEWFASQDLYAECDIGTLRPPVWLASRELQALYWIVRIYDSTTEHIPTDSICVFNTSQGQHLYDLLPKDTIALNAYTDYVASVRYARHSGQDSSWYSDTIRLRQIVQDSSHTYAQLRDYELEIFRKLFMDWRTEMNNYGLSYMRSHQISPIPRNRYKMWGRKREKL